MLSNVVTHSTQTRLPQIGRLTIDAIPRAGNIAKPSFTRRRVVSGVEVDDVDTASASVPHAAFHCDQGIYKDAVIISSEFDCLNTISNEDTLAD